MNIQRFNGSRPMSKKIVESLIKEEQENMDKLSLQSSASSLIKQIWDMVDAINANLILSQELNSSEFESVLNNMLTDCYTGIGQLEQFVQGVAPEAEAIDDGKDDTEIVDDTEVDDVEATMDVDATPSDLID